MEKNPEYQPLARKILEGVPFDEAMRELQIPGEQGKAAKEAVLKILGDRQTDELLLHAVAIDGIRTSVQALKKIVAEGPREGTPFETKNGSVVRIAPDDTDFLAAKALFDGSVKLKALVRGSVAPLPENAQKDIFTVSGEIEIKGPWKLKDPGV